MTDPNFKFRGLGLDRLKVLKIRFLGFWQKSYPFRYTFLLQHEVPMFFLYFLPKQHVCKNLVLELWSKNLRMQDSLNHNISQKTWGMKLNFWIWLEVQESTKYYLVASSGCAQACLNMPKVTTNSKSDLSQDWLELSS